MRSEVGRSENVPDVRSPSCRTRKWLEQSAVIGRGADRWDGEVEVCGKRRPPGVHASWRQTQKKSISVPYCCPKGNPKNPAGTFPARVKGILELSGIRNEFE